MAGNPQIESLKDLFYSSKFRKLLDSIESIEGRNSIVDLSPEIGMLKANTYVELNQVDQAIQALKALVDSAGGGVEGAYLYALGRLSYMNNDLQHAHDIFMDLLETTDDERLQFKSLLGMANVHYSQDNQKALEPILFDLRRFEPLPFDDEQISLLIFYGNYHCHFSGNFEESQKRFRQALEIAARHNWNYFICRAIYGQAVACERAGRIPEMEWTLNMLRPFVNDTESVCFSQIVNRRFRKHNFELKVPMEFDAGNRRIYMDGKWVAFHDRPLLYRFLEVVYGSESFVPKDAIAKHLWPNDEYKPRLHDPRMFDIAKRVREIVTGCNEQPLTLLSGRLGYKLACV